MNLTTLERRVVNHMVTEAMDAVCAETVQDAKEEYCAPCSKRELATACGTSTKVIRGVMSSLVQKGLAYHDDDTPVNLSTMKSSPYDFWLTDDGFDQYEADQ